MTQQSKEERVHHVFEKIYDNYDSMNSIISFKRHKAWRKDIMKRMQVKKNSKALDVCCGTGDWSLALAEAVGTNGEVIGLDFSKNMLSVAEKKKQESKLNQLNLIHGNAMELPFDDNSFEYVTIGFGLRNVPDYKTVIGELFRVVKPGGKVVCLETSQPTLIGYRQLYYFYFRFIMPLFGKLFAKSYNEYAWLHESAKSFPNKKELKQMFLDAGFSQVQVKSYAGGVAAMHMGIKG
ncbi:bifunctional demethylmenaquinone methyltransferase/2-methoxy-6-polyprenyl-1,4-benzoquinol methylase [Virgibacillus indicus]|uniref:Demethylmenaquinone methyltransferase n=1 Tax=Virgibacillus indicus TaxID=2024554 RepID=A0A265NF65_9BACI|nr:demethylmenaquinone methyltransferase [Virgibacillus indicus]OZU90109.1 bifunctional demethylmenaquinone methyltransferase/2-methoxy-6-polyprenyl-1,4-benzoquinol methylase [Virgibacillus indicus]